MRRFFPFLVALLLLVGCDGIDRSEGPQVAPSGPPEIDFALVRRHAQQFDIDLPSRPPGSQQEVAAATYILGHLQFAGYSPLLDAVPVKDQVQSSNVIAVPPTGVEPKVMVTVAYDTPGSGAQNGTGIGLFLELARAVNVAFPDHAVGFAALAEGAGRSGSASLAAFFDEQGLEPSVIMLRAREDAPQQLMVVGSCANRTHVIPPQGGCSSTAPPGENPFRANGFDYTLVDGNPEAVGRMLLGFLADVAD